MSPIIAFLRASTLHIGAVAAAASLREDLVADDQLTPEDIDVAYAVSRVTPGTNLLAMYAQLGHRLGGWSLAMQAVAVGGLIPAAIALLVAVLYTEFTSPAVEHIMAGARVGGVAVFLGSAIRFLKPQITPHPWVSTAFTLVALLFAWKAPVSLFAVLLVAGACGAFLLRPTS